MPTSRIADFELGCRARIRVARLCATLSAEAEMDRGAAIPAVVLDIYDGGKNRHYVAAAYYWRPSPRYARQSLADRVIARIG
jgi:hypothetical protein